MIYVIADITVKDFDKFEEFEHQASKVLQKHGAKMLYAFETNRNDDACDRGGVGGRELHLLQFPSIEALDAYKQDEFQQQSASLKAQAITAMALQISTKTKYYG